MDLCPQNRTRLLTASVLGAAGPIELCFHGSEEISCTPRHLAEARCQSRVREAQRTSAASPVQVVDQISHWQVSWAYCKARDSAW